MPESKNKKFYYLLHGEYVDFKLAPFNEAWIDDRKNILRVSLPHPTHISNKPFKGTSFKIMACAGKDRCPVCNSGHNPCDLFPTNIRVTVLGGDEKVMDMQYSAHEALLTEIQKLLDCGATYNDILTVEFRLTRLPKGQRPYYECVCLTEEIKFENGIESNNILSIEDIGLLRKISALVKTGNYRDPRGSVIKTLRDKYEWPNEKIELAFSTVLDDAGVIRDGK